MEYNVTYHILGTVLPAFSLCCSMTGDYVYLKSEDVQSHFNLSNIVNNTLNIDKLL